MTLVKLTAISTCSGVNSAPVRAKVIGRAKIKATIEKKAKINNTKFITVEVNVKAFFLSFLFNSVKSGIKAADNAPRTMS